jgi:hypothetical protein
VGIIIKQIAKQSLKVGEKIQKVDPNSPVSMDTTQFVLNAGKHLLDLIF